MAKTELIDMPTQKLKAILAAIGEGITIVDKDLKIIWVNSVIEKWAGPLKKIKGKHCYKVYQRSDIPCSKCPTLKTFTSGKVEKARQHGYDAEGNIRHFEFTSAPIKDEKGEITQVLELAVDLTEKIQLEHKLKGVKDQLQAVFDGISDGISVIDKNFQILRVNRGILNLFAKRDFPELIGKKCVVEYFNTNGMCDNCPAQKTFEEGGLCHVTKILHGDDKERMVLDITAFPIKNEDGKVIQVIEYMKNVTSLVKLEDQLLYQERLAGIGELAAGIAHEIRNPLGNITASTQFCLSKYKLHELAKKHLRIILRNAESANKIIKDLLDFAKPREISFEVSNIGRAINSASLMVKARCSKQRVRVTKRISRRLPQILLDEKRIEEAFLNFILNALDAMPQGGRLIINAHPDFKKDEVVITFSDTGTGIPQENMDKIFNPFFTTKKDGTGLGLSLAHQIIGYHKGKIDIESDISKGTEVVIRIPCKQS